MSGTDDATPPMPDIDGWLQRLEATLPPGTVDEAGPEERSVLLDLARIAAHESHRSAAPITTYLIGLVVAGHPRAARLERLRAIARELDGA